MDKVRFGIVGTGVGASFCAEGLSLIADEGKAELVAVTSRREERAREFASRWKLKYWYTDYRRMLREAPIDAVIISTPHYQHYPMTMDSLDADKHVLVDKPMAINLREADEMITKARKKNLKLGVNLQSRFDPVVKGVKEDVDNGVLGRLILGEAVVEWFRTQEYYDRSPWRGRWSTEGGGALINQAIHTIDLLIWIMGQPERLWAQMDTFTHKIEVEDLAAAVLRFKSGAIGVIQGSTAIYPGLPTRLEIHGTKGTIIVEGGTLKRRSIIGEKETISKGSKKGLKSWAKPELVPATNHASLIRDFANAILEGREPLVNGVEGRRSLEVIMAIYKSAENNSVVEFPL